MKLDIFNHIFPKKFYDRMLAVAPSGKDMHKRVRDIPSIVDLDQRFRIMDQFDDYAQVICLPSPPSSRASQTTAWRSSCASIRIVFRRSSRRCR